MRPFLSSGFIKSKYIDSGKTKRIWYGSWIDKKLMHKLPTNLKLPNVFKNLGKQFKVEVEGLNLVYGRHGDCTAFLLRKILEKSIYLAFAKNGMLHKLKHPKDPTKYIGLKEMINLASTEIAKDGTPFLLPKIAKELRGIKFLGDTAAHDFLYNIEIDEIEREINFMSVALGQISKKLCDK